MPVALVVQEASQAPVVDLTSYLIFSAVVIAAVLVLGWVVRRFFARTLRQRAAQRSLAVVDVLPLGGKQKLFVVRCYDRHFLVGAGDKELASIAELDPPESEQAPELELEEHEAVRPPGRGDFAELLVKEAPELDQHQVRPRRAVLENGRGVIG